MSTLLELAIASATETKIYHEGLGALGLVGEFVRTQFPGRSALVIGVSDTREVAGAPVEAALRKAGVVLEPSLVIEVPPFLHADYAWIERIRERLAQSDAVPVAVGSGTLNDLVKRAAAELGRPYVCVPTAASVDGYTSSGAAILKDGFKQTLACAAPLAVFADTEVLAGAPAYLTSSGYGDLASKLIAGADWLLADAAGADPLHGFAYRLTQQELRTILQNPEPLTLFRGLALTGFAMQLTKSSRPVSGCEHLFSHIWEMEDLQVGGRPVTHGHKVAIGTLIATAVYEAVLELPSLPERTGPFPSTQDREREVRRSFSGSAAAEGAVNGAVQVSVSKLSAETAQRRLSLVRDAWPQLRDRLRSQLIPYAELRTAMAAAGCPVTAEAIGLTRDYALQTAHRAQMIRDRYSVLDLLFDAGLLDEVLERVRANPA
ncbi:MAG: sn-glycerol-1-phosphate dehydrogenase [Spirochaetales bacterium]